MKNSKLISLLSSLDRGELRRFGDFVHSPYFNNNEEISAFYNILQKLYPDFPTEQVSKEQIYNQLYPKASFDKKKLGYLMTDLFRLIERFLSIQRLEKEAVLLECKVLSEYMERNLEKHYNYQLKSIVHLIENRQESNVDQMYYKYLLADIETKYFATKHVRVFDSNLQKVADALDNFYFLNKLKYSCEMLNRQAILSDQFSLPFMEEVQSFLSEKAQLSPLIAIYLQIYFSLLHPGDESHLDSLMRLIREHSTAISIKELRDVYLYAINFCVRKIREGKQSYVAITLELYQEGLANKSLYDDKNFVSHWTYNNTVKLALRLRRFEWIEQFIQEYNNTLEHRVRADALHYNLAELFFHKRDFDQALYHLNQVQFSDINYHIGSRILLIKTFYELDDIDPLLSVLASFSVWLRRNKQISVALKKSCLHFCNLLHKILNYPDKKKDKLQILLKETQPLADRAWIQKVFAEQFA